MDLVSLDDFQRVALDLADWSPLAGAVEITGADRHLGAAVVRAFLDRRPRNVLARGSR